MVGLGMPVYKTTGTPRGVRGSMRIRVSIYVRVPRRYCYSSMQWFRIYISFLPPYVLSRAYHWSLKYYRDSITMETILP
jgi:predicted CDP-diglyceride synthetase/phosphatidate cytidylyltransferase